jgi:NAD(P)-dependent dehydrogenase (short-subunit alcohol dehydrogenase family)
MARPNRNRAALPSAMRWLYIIAERTGPMGKRKTIFITGGGSGIGRAVAVHFANKGWFVGLADLNATGLAETAALLPDGQSSQHVMNVIDRDQWAAALANFAQAGGGRMDVLFNNAGIGLGGHFPDMPPTDADRLIDVNFRGVVNGIYAALDLLKATPGSVILNTSSASGIYGAAGLSVYSATKFAVRGLTEALDIELAQYGIKVRSLMPGFIDTPLLDQVVAGTNAQGRDRVRDAGLEFTSLDIVAQCAWDAVHGDRVHTPVGKTARQLMFLARWMPGAIRRRMKSMDRVMAR